MIRFTPQELLASMRPKGCKRLFPCGLEPTMYTGVSCPWPQASKPKG
jgi:hypothetical protein